MALLPLTLAILAAFHFNVRSEIRGHHMFFITAFVAAIAVLAVGGYTQGWGWTRFEGNTLFDRLKLIFLPVVIPLVLGLRRPHATEWPGGPPGRRVRRTGLGRPEPRLRSPPGAPPSPLRGPVGKPWGELPRPLTDAH